MPGFSMTMEIDANGVIVAVLDGMFSASAYIRLRREIFESRYGPADYDGRPIVADIRNCALPDRDWPDQFQEFAQFLRERRPSPFRIAIVIGDEKGAETAVTLFSEYQRLFFHAEVETRAFRDGDEAYAWALAGLRPPGEPEPAGSGRQDD
ncbi:hypothetical protein SAMN06265365_113137 [Tistlia consotensis]|uniref:SpoIIAA-like n=1 Tax=Tistlia consotensis USBA 355 TaxID=560819 RepID=A0A1Y6C2A5_9PROT|nr:hypothetical protein [Tistlia consotensis]SMF40296.1 hypothetical protein SAMN05428998_1148 [Tistlia consotensis USBA 355]SNR75115.1 hypothetical protein SAMN06265365_113137 [Tistlia consotensis]